MIVRILSKGKSFKGLAAYLTHDPDADTDKRVAWTHTLNCASDDVPGAVNEMLWTARDAELLKQEAGIRAGGRSTENTVKHVSLNWSPEDDPSREHMVTTAEEFLRHMKWDEHQAAIVAHDDKKYAHLHLMINVVHPETGLRLDDNFERRRAQAWALDYERENGRIHCEQRLADPREREDAPTRDAWMAFQENQRGFERTETSQREAAEKSAAAELGPNVARFDEWKTLKEFQRDEREAFFAEGKFQFSRLRSSVCAEVRQDFRERWADYYSELKAGGDTERLSEIKAHIIFEQRETLAARRDLACAELRQSRDETYRDLLDDQRQTRQELRGRQAEGWDNARFFEALRDREDNFDRAAVFRDAASEITTPERSVGRPVEPAFSDDEAANDNGHEDRHAGSLSKEIAIRAGMGAMSFLDVAFRAVTFTTPEGRPSPRELAKASDVAAAETAQREQREREAADEEWRRRQQARGE